MTRRDASVVHLTHVVHVEPEGASVGRVGELLVGNRPSVVMRVHHVVLAVLAVEADDEVADVLVEETLRQLRVVILLKGQRNHHETLALFRQRAHDVKGGVRAQRNQVRLLGLCGILAYVISALRHLRLDRVRDDVHQVVFLEPLE